MTNLNMFALKCFAKQMLTGLVGWLGIHMCEYRACLVPVLSGTVLWYNALSYSYSQPTHENTLVHFFMLIIWIVKSISRTLMCMI